MTHFKFFTRSFFLIILLLSKAEARFAKYEDAPLEIKTHKLSTIVNEDGTYEMIGEVRAKILKEHGREAFSRYIIKFNSNSSTLDILEAKTKYNEKEYIVTEDMIENKPLASQGYGFDQFHQIMTSYPNVELGAEIYLKYKQIVTKIPVDNFFEQILAFDPNYYHPGRTISVKSKLPLNIKVNDPNKALKITHGKINSFYTIDIVSTKPIYEEIINEPENAIIDNKYLTWVSISTLKKWDDLAKRLAMGYIEVINQPLPEAFSEIAKLASEKHSDVEKINFVTSSLNEKIHYMGDWRPVKASYYPRNLNEIANTRRGDCKDFSVSAGAILRNLGYNVNAILVQRGVYYVPSLDFLPGLYSFNHAMVRVENKSGNIYWIDPTNFTSMASGIFPDIAGKKILILDDKKNGCYAQIPNITPKTSERIELSEIRINKNLVTNKGIITYKGEIAEPLTGYALYYSPDYIKDMYFRGISGVSLEENEKKMLELPDLTSRIVKDITIKYEFQKKNQIFKTNLGSALTLPSSLADGITDIAPNQIKDIYIGIPVRREVKQLFKDVTVLNCSKLAFEIKTPWIEVKRLCKHQNKDTLFTDLVVIHKSSISSADPKTSIYKNFKSKIENEYDRASIILE